MSWKEIYKKNHKAFPEEAEMFLPSVISLLFLKFNVFLFQNYNLYFIKSIYTEKYGWKFKYGRDKFSFFDIFITENSFIIFNIEIIDEISFQKACKIIKDNIDNFNEAFRIYSERKISNQAEKSIKTGKWKRIGWTDKTIIKG